tara:strand:+ start:480 stop:2027 length:1548 start_codon:yes stop_codon:yes gene_type:complete
MVAINDRVKETTTTTGQGTVDLGGAKTGFETFLERIGNGNQTYYCIAAEGGSEFEVGIGTVSSGTPNTLSRDTVLSNSDNNTNKVTFSAGTKEVFCTLPASKAILEDSSNNMNVAGNIIVGGTVDGVDIATRDGVLSATVTTANAALPKAGGTMTGDISHGGSFAIDVANELTLDSGDGVIRFKDDGTQIASFANSSTDFVISNATQDKDIKFNGNDGGTGITALTLDMSAQGALVVNSDIKVPDNGKVIFGAGSDFQIYHESSSGTTIFSETGSNRLDIRATNLIFNNEANNKTYINCTDGGPVEISYDGTKRAETTNTGFTVTGTLTATTLAGSLPYSSLTGTPTIPSNNNQLTNGAGYVTSSGVTSVATGNGLSGGTITSTGTLTMSGSYSGSFSASSNITAYSSDERLKEFKGTIQQALDKVDQLNGYYYEWNDLAKSLDNGKSFKSGREVGVSAQEIEKVLPEVVTEAPIVKIENLDVDYKTVYYDKIVPLLIEAIKELRAEVKKLKEDK